MIALRATRPTRRVGHALAQLEDTVTLAPRDAIPTAQRAVAHRTQHTGAVIIRDPRLTGARTLGDQSGETSATQETGAIPQAMKVVPDR